MKILVIRFSSIGDIVLASPVFRCIKKQLPDAELHFLTKLSFRSVTEHNPYIDRFFYLEHNLDELIRQFKEEKYDYVIDLHRNHRSRKVKSALRKAKKGTIDKLSFQKILLTKLNINVMPERHITLRSLDALKLLGVADDGGGLDFFIGKRDEISDSDLPAGHLAGFYAIVIGGNHFTKKFPIAKHIEAIRQIDHPVILIGGAEDENAGREIAAACGDKVYNACGKFSIAESADIIRRAKLVVSNDTGMLYIACALKKPVIAIWGGTSPKLQVEPYYGPNFLSHQKTDFYENIVLNLGCQPCSRYGSKKCPLEHFNCMEKIDSSVLAGAIRTRL